MRYLISLLIALLMAHCSPSSMVIRSDVVDIVSPDIEETLPLDIVSDSLITASRVVKSDTVVVVRVEPHLRKVYVRAKPDTVRLVRMDTTRVTVKEETRWTEKFGLVVIGLAVGVLIAFLLTLPSRNRPSLPPL